MAKLVWDQDGQRMYETGTDRGVYYPRDDTGAYKGGVAWNGLTAVNENPSGAEPTDLWADNIKYLTLRSAEQFGATVESYTYPKEFGEANGEKELTAGVKIGQQARKSFGLCYRTKIGNDIDGEDHGYKLHLVYGCTASPSQRSYATVNDSPSAITFSHEISTVPVNVTGGKPTATVEVDSTVVSAAKMAALEEILYGSETEEARLPLPDEVATIIGTEG